MGANRRFLNKRKCDWCGKDIVTNRYGAHKRTCPRKPIELMTIAELEQRGLLKKINEGKGK